MTPPRNVILAPLALLAACASELPPEARPATQDEAAQVADVVARWTERVAPVSPRCQAYVGRLHVIDADESAIGHFCRACVPESVMCDHGQYHDAWACPAQRADTPIAVVWEGLSDESQLYAVHHESTHLLGHCERPPGRYWTTHTDPVLWGPDGVHPL